jgi:hypothetical protein
MAVPPLSIDEVHEQACENPIRRFPEVEKMAATSRNNPPKFRGSGYHFHQIIEDERSEPNNSRGRLLCQPVADTRLVTPSTFPQAHVSEYLRRSLP